MHELLCFLRRGPLGGDAGLQIHVVTILAVDLKGAVFPLYPYLSTFERQGVLADLAGVLLMPKEPARASVTAATRAGSGGELLRSGERGDQRQGKKGGGCFVHRHS